MALTLTFDAAVPVVEEPGYHQHVTTRQLAAEGNPADADSHRALWRDEPTKTLMLRPRQLDPNWLNSAEQLDSILRLNTDLVAGSSDVSNQRIFEAAAFGNNANIYIFHEPVGPSGAFPSRGAGPFPGAAPSLVGVDTPVDPGARNSLLRVPTSVLEGPALIVDPPYDPPVEIGDETDGRFVAHTAERLPRNQGLFLRWFHPRSQLGFPAQYEFYLGQYCLIIKDVVVEVFRDVSAHGDRSAWQKEMVAPLFSVGDFSPSGVGSVVEVVSPNEIISHDRSLLWLPYRRNQVLLYSSAGKWAVLTTRNKPRRVQDEDLNVEVWDITRSDTFMVWVLTPAAGRFQIQKLKYRTGGTIQAPIVTLDYTPGSSPTLAVLGDADHAGSFVTAARSGPPSYTLPENVMNDCPAPTTDPATDQRRKFGVTVTLQASDDRRWTPFFYGYKIDAPRTFTTPPTTPVTVDDTNPGSVLVSAKLTAGLKPGEGRFSAEVIDADPYPLGGLYYRSAPMLQLKEGGTPLFTGVGEPFELTPIHGVAGQPRRFTVTAQDRWKQLRQTFLRDQRDWTGFGHIDVVKFIAEQGGIDTTSAEFPTGYVPGTINTLNSALGGVETTLEQDTKDVEHGWRPRDEDTAASYIQRVAELYSGWYVGFRLDGTFFYLPRNYFTSPTVTFAATHAGSAPYFSDPVTFTTLEPEANVILVKAGDPKTGKLRYSAQWIDWASILNPAVVNYLGRWKAEVVLVGGTFSCVQLNWMARRIWQETRKRRRQVRFEADFVPSLDIGHVFTLGAYGNYRLISMEATLEKGNQHRARYEGELLESGVGL